MQLHFHYMLNLHISFYELSVSINQLVKHEATPVANYILCYSKTEKSDFLTK